MEKPVENVENSCGMWISPGLQMCLCQLILYFRGFYPADMCIFYKYFKNARLFGENTEISPLLLDKLMVSSKGWRESQLSTALSSVVGESCIYSQYTTRPYLAKRVIFLKGGFSHDSEGKEERSCCV